MLFSGGLDSILTVKFLEKQGIDVLAIIFQSYFFGSQKAEESARKNSIKFRVENISKDHLKIVKNPQYGRGRAMNPCIDCHLLMLQKAGKIMKKENFDFVATGEVLGQRPMSQNKRALELIDRKSGIAGKLLRPLSAKLLSKTKIEEIGLVNRERLLDLEGRSRKRQIDLAKKYKIKYYPSPSGGCILTEKEFSEKLKKLLEKAKSPHSSDVALLKTGRHFWEGKSHIIIGRNKNDNEVMEKLVGKGDVLIKLANFPSPLALIRHKNSRSIKKAEELVARYSKYKNNKNLKFEKCEY